MVYIGVVSVSVLIILSTFSLQRSGNLTIPADRLLHEIAFKLWKAPKYGA